MNKINLLLLSSLIFTLTSCATGSTLRTARVLDPGQIEFSGGIGGTQFGSAAPIIIGAYGVRENVEIEGRFEDHYVAFTPRLQFCKAEYAQLDALGFFELGYSEDNGFQWGPGVMIGRRWDFIEPYISYRYRHYSSVSEEQETNNGWKEYFLGASDLHYIKFGTRFYIPFDLKGRPSNWFIGIEGGPTIFRSDAIFEWAANIGFDY